MRSLMKTCLMNAHDAKLQSIVFPAIGTGNLTVPLHIASEIMYNEVETFSIKHGESTTVKDIRFVVFHKDPNSIRVSFEIIIVEVVRETVEVYWIY